MPSLVFKHLISIVTYLALGITIWLSSCFCVNQASAETPQTPTHQEQIREDKNQPSNAQAPQALEPIKKSSTSSSGDAKPPETSSSEKSLESPKTDNTTSNQPEDRRWIIKQPEKQSASPVKKQPLKLHWTGKAQESKCTAYLHGVRDSFLNARYYSIKGDACKTAEYSKEFNFWVKKCEKECPEGYLKIKGYPDKTLRNLKRLEELGIKRCFQGDRQSKTK